MYSNEYIWTQVEILDTTINIIEVKESNKNVHLISNILEKIQWKQLTLTLFCDVITSLRIDRAIPVNKSILNIASRNKSLFLKKKLVKIKAKKLNKGKNKIRRYILSV